MKEDRTMKLTKYYAWELSDGLAMFETAPLIKQFISRYMYHKQHHGHDTNAAVLLAWYDMGIE